MPCFMRLIRTLLGAAGGVGLGVGETSDGAMLDKRAAAAAAARQRKPSRASTDDDEEEAALQEQIDDIYNTSHGNNRLNTNTMESVSARSFGFVKPSPKQRETDFKSRLRRHKSFFTPDSAGSYNIQPQNGGPPSASRRKIVRRAESFHHSRSMGDLHHRSEDLGGGGSGSRLSNVLRARQMIQDHMHQTSQ